MSRLVVSFFIGIFVPNVCYFDELLLFLSYNVHFNLLLTNVTCLCCIASNHGFVSLGRGFLSKVVLKVLLDIFGGRAWPRVDTPFLPQGENLV